MVNLLYELGQIMSRYDFLLAILVILSNVRTDSNLTWLHFWSTFHMHLGEIITRYDFLWARRVILRNIRTDFNLSWYYFWSTFHMNWWKIMTRYYILEVRWMILTNVWTDLNLLLFRFWSEMKKSQFNGIGGEIKITCWTNLRRVCNLNLKNVAPILCDPLWTDVQATSRVCYVLSNKHLLNSHFIE